MADAHLPPLIQAMLDPAFYPHPAQDPIQLIQTHISYILLTGDYAYKVKKPLDFGFLNFTTLEQRRHFCQEELRMNQRGAPGLYLQVLPIFQTNGRFQFSGSGELVEYALQMRQFPQEQLFSNLFERGELTPALMEELGRVVAMFHAQAETNDYIRSFGRPERVREAFDENYAQTQRYIGGPQTARQYRETRAYTDRFFAERQELFQQRIEQDRIRECHGDLHLRNICFWEGKILLFDCIEFNEAFRFVDVMYDVSYAVMDLDARYRPDLGNVYLNTYLEETGDWEGLKILPIYLNRQAYVRAKVTSFLLEDPTATEETKATAFRTAARYYRLAWEYTLPKQGQLFLMSGLSGSGKSTVARHLARQQGAIHIRSDAVRKHLAGIPLWQRGGPAVYTPEMTDKTYRRLVQLGVELAQEGYTVILDAKFDRQALRGMAIAQAQQRGIPLHILHCYAPEPVLRERLQRRSQAPQTGCIDGVEQRPADIADATAEMLTEQQAHWEEFSELERPFLRVLDTSQDWPSQLQQLWVSTQTAPSQEN
ncbi:AAA family ATPase [Synechococcus sp. H55.2]|uniref:bifunctional aminoglycoside phosphotransferase/ATP-binding protein n=1 Tax=unclassified Synechococcus TaxID=2626047 RepID=UPI0039C3DFEA